MRYLLFILCSFASALIVSAEPPANLLKNDPPEQLVAKSKQVLAKLDGDIALSGLKEPVEVIRDRWGIAHIYAKNQPDLFFAQGFVAAQDRLFQIEMWRRQAAGEMAELFGPDYFAADRFARLMKYRGDPEAEWTSYSPDTKEIATSFTSGINACIDQLGEKLPIEFQILGFKPKKWKPEDVLGRMSGIYMSQNFRNEIQRAQLIAAFGIEKARWMAPVDPPREYTSPLSMEELKAIDKRILADYEAATKALSFTPAKTESNNWVVSGQKSASGKPLLASDPHRAIALPSLRYLVHLNAPGWNVIGSGEPGLPGVAIGHNDKIAWGFTIIGVDQADFYVEETNPLIPHEYKVNGKWEPMTSARETIAVRGEKDRTVDLFFTRHGPVLYRDDKRHRAYALEWVGNDPGGAAYLASLAVDRAQHRKDFFLAMARWKVPGLNFVFADVNGGIGWIAAAQTPIRPKHDGLLPVPGDGGFEWNTYLKVNDLPMMFDPAPGWLATANHNIIPVGYKKQIGYEFAPPYRFQRIKSVLESKEKWTLDDFRALQHDDLSLPGLSLCHLLRTIDLNDQKLNVWRDQLIKWDGKLNVDSVPATLYQFWVKEMQEAFTAPHLTKEQKKDFGALVGLPVMERALCSADRNWFRDNATRDTFLRTTFTAAVKKLEASPQTRWGDVHKVTFRHPLSTLDPSIAKAFNIGSFGRGGDANTPNNTRFNDKFEQIHGASYRHLIDLADWDKAIATSTPGQSGQPGSPYYSDLAPLWAKAEYFPLAFSREKVDGVLKHKLKLTPK
jgi:penicillin G amidase